MIALLLGKWNKSCVNVDSIFWLTLKRLFDENSCETTLCGFS